MRGVWVFRVFWRDCRYICGIKRTDAYMKIILLKEMGKWRAKLAFEAYCALTALGTFGLLWKIPHGQRNQTSMVSAHRRTTDTHD